MFPPHSSCVGESEARAGLGGAGVVAAAPEIGFGIRNWGDLCSDASKDGGS